MAKHRRLILRTWRQALEEGFTRFCWVCSRIYKTDKWAFAHMDATGHALGDVETQAAAEARDG